MVSTAASIATGLSSYARTQQSTTSAGALSASGDGNDVMTQAGLTSETYLKIQNLYKRLSREQRSKMKQVMTICVFGTPHAFDPNEVIFELEMKNNTPCYEIMDEQTDCFSCKEKLKKAVACEFCAMLYCNNCRMRSRAFPSSIELENGDKITGKICKICDRKFLMLD